MLPDSICKLKQRSSRIVTKKKPVDSFKPLDALKYNVRYDNDA